MSTKDTPKTPNNTDSTQDLVPKYPDLVPKYHIRNNSKVQLHYWILEDVNERFRQAVNRRLMLYQGGNLSSEVELALELYIAFVSGTHTQNTKSRTIKPVPKTYQLKQDIKQYLADNHKCPILMTNQYTFKLLAEAIRVIRNLVDNRQVKVWCEALKRDGYLKEISPFIYELT